MKKKKPWFPEVVKSLVNSLFKALKNESCPIPAFFVCNSIAFINSFVVLWWTSAFNKAFFSSDVAFVKAATSSWCLILLTAFRIEPVIESNKVNLHNF